MYNLQRFEAPVVDAKVDVKHAHEWVTVPNPMNKRVLLQACDNCGVVKSENTLFKHCRAESDRGLITQALAAIQH